MNKLFFPETCHLNSSCVLWPGKLVVSASQDRHCMYNATLWHVA